jgi:hypothetical protein
MDLFSEADVLVIGADIFWIGLGITKSDKIVIVSKQSASNTYFFDFLPVERRWELSSAC